MAAEPEEKKEGGQPSKSSKMKLILIMIVAVLVLGGGGAGAYFKFFAGKSHNAPEEQKPKEEVVIIKELDTFIVNLSDPGGKRFLKVTMKVKVGSPQSSDEFSNRTFELRDIILTVLSGKEYEDIAKPSDKAALKQELITSLNNVLHKGPVQDVYFTEFLIQ